MNGATYNWFTLDHDLKHAVASFTRRFGHPPAETWRKESGGDAGLYLGPVVEARDRASPPPVIVRDPDAPLWRITTEGRTVLWRGHKSDLEREAQQLSLPGITIEPVEEEPEEPTK